MGAGRAALARTTEHKKGLLRMDTWKPGIVRMADGNLYDWKGNQEEYLTDQCAMLADQNIRINSQTLYDLQPGSERRCTVEQIQQWLDRHPNYAEGRY